MSRQGLVWSRARVERNWALLPSRGMAATLLPEWKGTVTKILAAPAMGAAFAQYELAIERDGGTQQTLPEAIESFLFVLAGELRLDLNGAGHRMARGGFAYMRPGSRFLAETESAARLLWIKKRYVPFAGARPHDVVGDEQRIPGETYMDLEGLLLKTLLPVDPAWDMAMNIFTFPPGASLPVIETHVMEHGLLMLEGQGVYYLGHEWLEVEEGDFIWMGPFVPQSFYATGAVPARYLYYKDVHRDVSL